MLFQRIMKRNPGLIEAAIDLHQRGDVPPATFLVDLDAIADNARTMAEEAHKHGLRVFLMTKQNGRNPYITRVALAQGIDSTVVVETIEARIVHRFGLPIGHVGHLSNIPMSAIPHVLAMEPEFITVFTVESARAISDAAAALGREQALYVRVNKQGDEIFRGMVGGWLEEDCVQGIAPILELPSVRLAGLTSFPTTSYRTRDPRKAVPTDSFHTMMRAKEKLENAFGLSDLRVNAPSFNNTATFAMLAQHGATDVEPGTGLLGSSLAHAHHDLPEKPAQVFVSEVMHHWEGETYTLGGGLTYLETYGGQTDYQLRCMIGSSFDEAKGNFMNLLERGVIDYHVVCGGGGTSRVGDTALYALHPQYFVNRAYVGVVSGVSRGAPKLEALFDSACNELDENFRPVPPETTVERMDRLVQQQYAAAVA